MFLYIVRLVLSLLCYGFVFSIIYCFFSIKSLKRKNKDEKNINDKKKYSNQIKLRKKITGFSIFGMIILIVLSVIIPK